MPGITEVVWSEAKISGDARIVYLVEAYGGDTLLKRVIVRDKKKSVELLGYAEQIMTKEKA